LNYDFPDGFIRDVGIIILAPEIAIYYFVSGSYDILLPADIYRRPSL